jgi:hypothetical protein
MLGGILLCRFGLVVLDLAGLGLAWLCWVRVLVKV